MLCGSPRNGTLVWTIIPSLIGYKYLMFCLLLENKITHIPLPTKSTIHYTKFSSEVTVSCWGKFGWWLGLRHSIMLSLSASRKWTHSFINFWKYSLNPFREMEILLLLQSNAILIWVTKNALRFLLKSQRQAFCFQKYNVYTETYIYSVHIWTWTFVMYV